MNSSVRDALVQGYGKVIGHYRQVLQGQIFPHSNANRSMRTALTLPKVTRAMQHLKSNEKSIAGNPARARRLRDLNTKLLGKTPRGS